MNLPFNNFFAPPNYNPNTLLKEGQEIPPNIDLQKESIFQYQFEKKHPSLMKAAEEANNQELDFNSEILEISKTQVTLNLLPQSRYGRFQESKLRLVTQTNLISQVEHFLGNFYMTPTNTCWITGPSGGGKSFSILHHVLRTRKSRKDIVLVHMIMSDEYFKKLPSKLFNDVFYAFYPFLRDKDFPVCPYIDAEKKTHFPLINWFMFLSDNLNKPTIFDHFIDFFSVAQDFFTTKEITFAIVIDQINIIQRLKNQHLGTLKDFFDFLDRITICRLSHKVIISSSDSNEDLNSTLMAKENEEQIFKAGLNGTFSREQVKLILQHYCDFQLEEAQVDKLEEITGFVPLEIWSFDLSKGKSFEEKFRNYIQDRTDQIQREIDIFYKNKTDNKNESKWEVTFLQKNFVLLDTESQIIDKSYEITIDRRYMFVKEKKLYSVSPIAREVLNFFYSEKLSELKQEHQDQFICNLLKIYKNLDSQCDASLKGYVFEKLLIHQLIANESNLKKMLLTYHHYTGETHKKVITFSKVVFFQNELYSVISDTSSVYVPFKFNYPFVDLFLYDSTDSILYAFQITLNIKSHKNSDTQFKSSEEYAKLKAKTFIKNIIFIWVTETAIDYGDISGQFEPTPQKKKKQNLRKKNLSKSKEMMAEEIPKSNSKEKKSTSINTGEEIKQEFKEESEAVPPIVSPRRGTRLADKIQNKKMANEITKSEKGKGKKAEIEEELKQSDSNSKKLEDGDNDGNQNSKVNNYKDKDSYFVSVAENQDILTIWKRVRI